MCVVSPPKPPILIKHSFSFETASFSTYPLVLLFNYWIKLVVGGVFFPLGKCVCVGHTQYFFIQRNHYRVGSFPVVPSLTLE